MNSNPNKSPNPPKGSVNLNNFEFDFGLGSNFSNRQSNRSLNGQKQSTTPNRPVSSASWAPNKPSWTHQPAPSQAPRPGVSNPPSSMVGDIFGKSWNSTTTTTTTTNSSHVTLKSNPNLFGDLIGTALGQGKNSNVPLKDVMTSRSSYSMENLADFLPKTDNKPMKNTTSWGSADNLGNFSSINGSNSNKSANFVGSSMRSGVQATTTSEKKDPFGSLVDFGSKPPVNASNNNKNKSSEYSFGDFQDAAKTGGSGVTSNPFPPVNGNSNASNSAFPSDPFPPVNSNSKSLNSAFPSDPFPPVNSNSKASNSASVPKMDDFGLPDQGFASQKGVDPLDMLFSSSASTAAPAAEGSGNQPFSEIDDWGLDSEFAGSDMGGGTIEIEGLPPPPAGVTASSAKNKGLDNHKQGQFADAIKWLSWAVALIEKSGDNAAAIEVLSCRASCYKEVGEYKKAIADCSKALEHESANVSILLQRALLFESSEKYKLGAEDLRTVLKIDPSNRLAKSTIHRLAKMAD
eukprot:TRINITY_DN800_c0_g1_i1.p1 TRINITY_DN800_c0_g1~~TRINITY_DN800_c0_g1_i1.p1  ORF type:complete len:517 (+),score=73.40 TRINITY_DN800_c0_g1_i1:152-1702(+)